MKITRRVTLAHISVLLFFFSTNCSLVSFAQNEPLQSQSPSIGVGLIGSSLVGAATRYGRIGGGGVIFVEYPLSEKFSLDGTVSFASILPSSEASGTRESKITMLPYIASFRYYPSTYHTGVYFGGGLGGAHVRYLERVIRPMAGAHDSSNEYHALALVPKLGYSVGQIDVSAQLMLLKDAIHYANSFSIHVAYRVK